MKTDDEQKYCKRCGKAMYFNMLFKRFECRRPECPYLHEKIDIDIIRVAVVANPVGINFMSKNVANTTATKRTFNVAIKAIEKEGLVLNLKRSKLPKFGAFPFSPLVDLQNRKIIKSSLLNGSNLVSSINSSNESRFK